MAEPTPSAGLSAVRAWCGWHVAPSRTETVEVESDGASVMLLPSLHVTGVSEVRDEDAEVVSSDSYKWRKNGIVRGCWWKCNELYEFDITHGYDDMPLELQQIIDDLNASGVGSTVTRETSGPFSREFGSADLESQPISVRSIISRYKLPPRP